MYIKGKCAKVEELHPYPMPYLNFTTFQIMSTELQHRVQNCLTTDSTAPTLVYHFQSTDDGRNFAIRFLNSGLLCQQFPQDKQKELLDLYTAECQEILNLKVSHVNIVQYLDVYSDVHVSNGPGLVTEPIDMSLTTYLYEDNRAQQPVSLPIQIGLSHDIAQALTFLHQQGIMHQNLSANSIFLKFDNQLPTPLAKVGDFGMTKFYESIGCCTEMKSTRVDIFAFGVLMTQIMTKQRNIQVSDVQQIISHLGTCNPLVSIIHYCLQGTDIGYPSADFLAMSIAKQAQATIQDLQAVSVQIIPQKFELAGAPLQRSCDAVMDRKHNIIYLRQGKDKKLFTFNLNDNTWKKYSIDCELLQCALVFFEDNLLAIGGAEKDESPRSNEVYKLVEDVQHPKWEPQEPRLMIPRSRSTALACDFNGEKILIVAGGETLRCKDDPSKGFEALSTVEVLRGQVWHLVCGLPGTLCCASGTVVRDDVCLLGGWRERDEELLAVYTCRLSDLIRNEPFTQVWSTVKISPCPVALTTCTTIQDKLLIIGGTAPNDPKKKPGNAIRVYKKYTNYWDIVGYLPAPRYLCYAQALCESRFLVVGGCKDSSVATDDTHVFELK